MSEVKMACCQCRTHWSDCDVLADGKCASCLRAEIERLTARVGWFERSGGVTAHMRVHQQQAEITRLRDAVLFFSKHYDGPPDNMLTTWERDLFQVPDEIKSARAAGGE